MSCAESRPWSVSFFTFLQSWHGGDAPTLVLDFADEAAAVIWARTQEMGLYRLAVVRQAGGVRAMYLRPPRDASLMRQERVEIPVLVPAGNARLG